MQSPSEKTQAYIDVGRDEAARLRRLIKVFPSGTFQFVDRALLRRIRGEDDPEWRQALSEVYREVIRKKLNLSQEVGDVLNFTSYDLVSMLLKHPYIRPRIVNRPGPVRFTCTYCPDDLFHDEEHHLLSDSHIDRVRHVRAAFQGRNTAMTDLDRQFQRLGRRPGQPLISREELAQELQQLSRELLAPSSSAAAASEPIPLVAAHSRVRRLAEMLEGTETEANKKRGILS